MIEHLDRTHESVHFRENAHIRMYNNIQAEAYPPHWHNETEIILVRSGKLHVRCGGEDYFLQAGDILLICPSSIHEIFKESTGSRCYLLVDLYGLSVLQELKTAFSLLVPAVLISRQTIPNGFSYFQELFRNIYNLYFGDSIFEMNFQALDPENVYSIDRNTAAMSLPFMNETQIYSILLDFGASLAKEVQTAAQKTAPPKKNSSSVGIMVRNHQAIQQACGIVLSEFAEPISLDSVSERIGFSKYHFERVFKQVMHMTFYQYVTKVRISHSQLLLADASISITDIAIASGFSGSSAFSRVFRQETGKSPSEFRKILQAHI